MSGDQDANGSLSLKDRFNDRPVMSGLFIILFLLSVAATTYIFRKYLGYIFYLWTSSINVDEKKFFTQYHNIFFAPLALYMIVRNTFKLWSGGTKNYYGILFVVFSFALCLFGGFSSIYYVANIGFVLSLTGLCVAYWGLGWVRVNWNALILLLVIIPLPQFILINIYTRFAAVISRLSVYIAQASGLTVFIDGNVINFGSISKHVMEVGAPCAYLFFFVALGVSLLYFLRPGVIQYAATLLAGPVILFGFAVIRTIVMVWIANARDSGAVNAFYSMTSGGNFLAAVIVSQLLLFAAMKYLDFHREKVTGGNVAPRGVSLMRFGWPEMRSPLIASAATAFILSVSIFSGIHVSSGDREMPHRNFHDFPLVLGAWKGSKVPVDPEMLKSMQLKDNLSADYFSNDGTDKVNIWVAYYGNQRPGASIHSPKACLPGSGWEMYDDKLISAEWFQNYKKDVKINRAIMKIGSDKQLTYYWYNVAGKTITNEYAMKWYIFWNKMIRSRTDGALIRLITPIKEGEPPDAADSRLRRFMNNLAPILPPYVPHA